MLPDGARGPRAVHRRRRELVTPRGAPSALAVSREGHGPEVLLVHGGASPATTWTGLDVLREHWTLASVHRRGYPPSPGFRNGRQDFEVDAGDLIPLLEGGPHLVGHSYGGLGALIAATRSTERVRSLTLIEPALFLPPDDPEVARLQRLGDTVLTHGLETDPAALREFLTLAGACVDEGPLPDAVARGVRRAHGSRSPGEARPEFDVMRNARVPTLVVSGGHNDGMERICDALAVALGGERMVAPGAGHFVAAAPGFAERLHEFLLAVGDSGRPRGG